MQDLQQNFEGGFSFFIFQELICFEDICFQEVLNPVKVPERGYGRLSDRISTSESRQASSRLSYEFST